MTKDEFNKAYAEFAPTALTLAAKARKQGLLSLDKDIDHEKADERDIFHYGLRFTVDAYDSALFIPILNNIIEQEKDPYTAQFKIIQREAVYGIHQGYDAKVLFYMLNSLTDIPLKNDKTGAGYK
ncbi:MAG: hypothetical protein LBC75_11700 [Fibromonadaceae bacterium]|jgi:flagellar motor component MotA|nr:hypothetical protein [Fibromonadaceae bacterium]